MSSLTVLIERINDAIINPLLGLLLMLAFFWFMWGLFVFIANAGNEEGRKKGKRHMVWATIGLFLIVSIVGILRITLNTFDVPAEKRPEQLR